MSNPLFAGAEAGCVAQNVYIGTASLGLGTCVVATIDNGAIGNALNLGSNLTPLFVMPVSYPLSNYPAATPDYSRMAGNLPRVEINSATFEDAVNSESIRMEQDWGHPWYYIQKGFLSVYRQGFSCR